MANFDSIKYERHFNQPLPPPKRRRWKRRVFLIIILGAILAVGYQYLYKTNKIFTGHKNIFTRVGGFFISQDKPLIGEDEGLINVLLMGIGGEGHEGAHLTDTMIVASINTKTNEVTLVSIPRDFAVTLPKYGFNKINAAYAYTYRDDPDHAGEAAMTAAEQITGFKIPYFAVIDFKGFVKAVDDVGGLDITIDNTFTDATFPNDYPFDTKGYLTPVTFTKGKEHMNGQRALIFARSRHSDDNNEGSDFARSERQKKIIAAFKEKVLSLKLTNLSTLNNLLSDFTENFRTNLEPHELKRLADLAGKINSDNIYSFNLEPDGSLICSALVDPETGKPVPPPAPAPPAPTPTPTPTPPTPPSKTPKTTPSPAPTPTPTPTPVAEPEVVRLYVIQACYNKSLTDIHNYLKNYFDIARLKKEGAVVEIQNSTGRSYATTKFKTLSEKGIVTKDGIFKGKLPFEQTVLYDNSHDSKPRTKEFLNANFSLTLSDITYPTSKADFVIIVGRDAL